MDQRLRWGHLNKGKVERYRKEGRGKREEGVSITESGKQERRVQALGVASSPKTAAVDG